METLRQEAPAGKTCTKCGTFYEDIAAGFYFHNGRPHGGRCKTCYSEVARTRYRALGYGLRYWADLEYRERLKARARERATAIRSTPEGRAAWDERSQRWRKGNPDKKRAQDERDKAWRREAGWVTPGMRQAVLDRDGGACLACGATERLTVDHVVPVSAGGMTDLDNLQALCGGCNCAKATKIIDYR